MEPITWKNIKVRLGDLKPWADNPRLSSKEQAQNILTSWQDFNQVGLFAVSPELDVYDGHQRLSALLTLYGEKYKVDARQSSRLLTEDERKRLVILLHAGAVGSWNWDILANWNSGDLKDWGLNTDMLKEWKVDISALSLMLDADKEPDLYTRSIQAPIYVPKGEKPSVGSLFDDTKTKALLKEIEAAEIPENEKEFLRVAAARHTVINYKLVAEYYSHSHVILQRLFEESALVIIDFDKAIELGYVKLSEAVAAEYEAEYPNAK